MWRLSSHLKSRTRNSLLMRHILVISFLLAFILSIVLFWFFSARDKYQESKILLAILGEDLVYITDFDFTSSEMVTLALPLSTEVEVARNLGSWELASVWRLGEDEKVGGGRLLAETLRDNLLAPVYYFSSKEGEMLLRGSPFSSIVFPFVEKRSNLSFLKRVRVALFSARFKNLKSSMIDLSETGFVVEENLKTGKRGYRIKGELPQDVFWVFSDPLFLENKIFVSLMNETGSSFVVGRVNKILGAMGAKLATVSNQNATELDCEISARDKKLVSNLALVFSCRIVESRDLEKNEVVLRVGRKFKERF